MKTTLFEKVTEELKNRKYKAVWYEYGEAYELEFGLFDEFSTDSNESAILKNADKLLGMCINDTIFFATDETDNNIKGVIGRVK